MARFGDGVATGPDLLGAAETAVKQATAPLDRRPDLACVFVCGDACRMARDVDEALCGIVAEHGDRSPKSAAAYLKAMSAEGRYVRDVY